MEQDKSIDLQPLPEATDNRKKEKGILVLMSVQLSLTVLFSTQRPDETERKQQV